MKLLVDAHVFDGKFQGTRTYIQGIYTNMTDHKDIDFYFTAYDIENLKKVFGEANNIHYVQLQTRSSIKRLAIELPKIIKQYGIDYAHYQYIAPLKKCCKEINTVHDLLFIDYPQYFPWSFRVKNTFLFKRSAKRADILLTVSTFSKNEIIRHFNIEASKISITPNGVLLPPDDMVLPDVRNKFGLDKYIMTVSRIEPRKNHQMLLRVYVEMELFKKGVKLLIIGAMDLKNIEFNMYYDSLSDEIKRNILIYQVSYPELIALYKNATMFVFPSLAEGFGIPPIEAVSLGCTTLCSNQTAMADFDFFGDKLFDPKNHEELKGKIAYYLDNYDSNLEHEKNIIAERYNWATIAKNLFKLLEEDIHK